MNVDFFLQTGKEYLIIVGFSFAVATIWMKVGNWWNRRKENDTVS